MKLQYDHVADAAMLYLTDRHGASTRQEVVDIDLAGAAIVLDVDESDRVFGIEFLGASRVPPSELISSSDG